MATLVSSSYPDSLLPCRKLGTRALGRRHHEAGRGDVAENGLSRRPQLPPSVCTDAPLAEARSVINSAKAKTERIAFAPVDRPPFSRDARPRRRNLWRLHDRQIGGTMGARPRKSPSPRCDRPACAGCWSIAPIIAAATGRVSAPIGGPMTCGPPKSNPDSCASGTGTAPTSGPIGAERANQIRTAMLVGFPGNLPLGLG